MGKWAPAEYERVCTEKLKHLFYKASGGLDASVSFDADVERKFRAFIKNLDVDNAVINNHFRNIVKRQTRLDETAEGKAVADQARPNAYTAARTAHPRYYRYQGGPNARHAQSGPSSSTWTSSLPMYYHQHDMGGGFEGEAETEEDDGWYIAGAEPEFDVFAYDDPAGLDAGDDQPVYTVTGEPRRRTASPPQQHPGTHSPPWSLSHERQRARTAQPGSSDVASSEIDNPDLPLFLPVGDTPLPGDDLDEQGVATTAYDPLPFPMDPIDTTDPPRPDWMQMARNEIDGETAPTLLRTTGPAVDGSSPMAEPTGPGGPGEGIGSRRRRRDESQDASTTRAVRQRTDAAGLPRPASMSHTRDDARGVYFGYHPPRMQRTRPSMPPLAVGRDTRRDGIVWDLDPDTGPTIDELVGWPTQ